jgi:hypothetical protein
MTPIPTTQNMTPMPTITPTTPKPTVTPTAPKPTALTQPTAPRVNLSADYQALLLKNNPTLYKSLYGSTPVEVNAGDVGTTGLNVGNKGTDTTSSTFVDTTTNSAEQALVQSQTEQEQTGVTGGNQDLANIRDWMQQVFVQGQEFDPAKIKEEEGVYAAKEELNAINNKIISEGKATRDRVMEMRQNPEGKLAGALQADIENYTYERADYMADLAISQMAAQGNYSGAYEIASDRIKAEEMRYDRQTSFLKDMYTMVQDDMTASEKMVFQSQLSMAEYGQKTYIDAKTTALQRAATNNAPYETLQAIKNAKNMDEVWLAAGQYGVDPEFQLAKDKYYYERDIAYKRLAIENAKNAGDITAKTAEKLIAQANSEAKYNEMLEQIDSALGNTLGFNVATGKVKGAGASALFDWTSAGGYFPNKQAQETFANSIDYVVSNLTTQALAEAKSLGITFGALSNEEMKMLGGAADVLSAAWDRESMTFRGTPTAIQKALDELYTATEGKKAVNALGQEKVNAITTVWNQS